MLKIHRMEPFHCSTWNTKGRVTTTAWGVFYFPPPTHSCIKYGSAITLSNDSPNPLLPTLWLNISWGIPTRNVFLMTEQLQQLRGKSLSNEQHRNAGEALSLTNACSQQFAAQTAYLLLLFTERFEDCACFTPGCRSWGNANNKHRVWDLWFPLN